MNIDWQRVQAAAETAAALLAVAGSVYVVFRLIRGWWRQSIGLRRAQARVLDRLACGEPVERVNTWLGLPVSSSERGHTYELPGAWVHITVEGDAVESFAITIRHSRLFYRTERLTFGMFNVKLGQDTFGAANISDGGGVTWIGARRMGAHIGPVYGGNPFMYQNYWIGYNDAGAGDVLPCRQHELDAGRTISAETTINTLRVGKYGINETRLKEFARENEPVGVDYDWIRVRLTDEAATARRHASLRKIAAKLKFGGDH